VAAEPGYVAVFRRGCGRTTLVAKTIGRNNLVDECFHCRPEVTSKCVTCMLVASELAHAPTILAVMCVCALFSALVGRWWTLALPVVLVGAVFALEPLDSFYERTPEDIQAGVVFGAAYGLVLAAVALLVRHYLISLAERRRNLRSESANLPLAA
jgi:hypothetical protein